MFTLGTIFRPFISKISYKRYKNLLHRKIKPYFDLAHVSTKSVGSTHTFFITFKSATEKLIIFINIIKSLLCANTTWKATIKMKTVFIFVSNTSLCTVEKFN